MTYKKTVLITLFCVFIMTCKQNIEETQIYNGKTIEQSTKITSDIYGNYVDDSYSKRAEGFDWVAISIKPNNDKSISVSVRSRADKKRPTCTFDTKAFKKNENSYKSIYNGKIIIFEFSEENITISAENPDESNMLYFFCNGGATIAGTYKKINEELDQQQIDLTKFMKVLNLQDIGFNISSIEKNGKNTLTIFTFGLEEGEYNETFNIENEKVIDAEVEDLNLDGSPELFVYTRSVGSHNFGNVYAFSVNNKKSISQVYFKPTVKNSKINQGYMGHDEFSLIENTFGQRFPIFKEGDTNTEPTGGTRQVSYKLIDDEASRKLVVDKISEY
jgi:hypothetical protein